LAKTVLLAFLNVGSCVGQKPNVPFVLLVKFEIEKSAVGKIKYREGLAMSVGLLVLHLIYHFYVCVHLSKWIAFLV
jgi:hypothetical protein